ncbi:hypothetical protein METP1_03649 [Methanosarcinales archaeon]|nr:hypothetical protein METP1_03649 [Methanosarcinales archaeon]
MTFMIEFNSLPLLSKIILVIGFTLGTISLIIFLRYPIMLILMKYNPKYREFIKKSLVQKKLKNSSIKHKYK